MANESISLVCMPWHLLGSPSIQLGTLQALLERAGITCRSHSLYLEFLNFLRRSGSQRTRLDIDDYGAVCSQWMNVGAGDWVFAIPAIRAVSRERDGRFKALCSEAGMPDALLGKLERLRELAPVFLERCADEILAADPGVVGFTCVYSQTLASAALAHTLKARAPHLKIVFGGASCEGPMGPALLRAFPDVDVVVRGEAEPVLCELVECLLEKTPIPHKPGFCLREDGRCVEVPMDEGPRVAMDEVPMPVFDEYFERLARTDLAREILPQLPFETARGCWWGMKSHCTFCGLNGMEMSFRSKSPERVLDELSSLARRHAVLDFTCVDNIIDMKYFDSLLPRLAERGDDYSLFFETKSNLKQRHVVALRDAGVRAIQPGIESLSTPILKLMKKGVTALQNIRLLKWCARHEIRVIWNLIYGFPGESPEEYARMAELAPLLVHLEPPSLSALMTYRFSPYFSRPAEHGIRLDGPLPCYQLLYDVEPDALADLAHVFEFTHADGRDPEAYTAPLRAAIEGWHRDRSRNAGALSYRRGPGFMVIVDSRTTTPEPARYTLGEEDALVYLACDAGATLDGIARALCDSPAAALSQARLRATLDDFLDARLVYEEAGRYLSLAVPNSKNGS
jgi:ribosomal peptide maturation radical SAM protein 1